MSIARAEETEPTALPPLVNQGAPADVMQDSALLPRLVSPIRPDTGSAGIERSLNSQLPLPVAIPSTPGSYTSFRGLGRTADEINFQVFGVPLNGPQGGGFDLSSFPQYLWSDYRYQSGPSLGGFDPRGSAGTVTLTPWTQTALDSKDKLGFRFMQTHSFLGQSQTSFGSHFEGKAAALVGFSSGFSQGPSGSLSTRWENGKFRGQVHFLGTRLDSVSPGPQSAPTPDSRQVTSRVLPVVQTDYAINNDSRIKTSLFFDLNQIDFNSPELEFNDKTHAQQLGFDSVWVRRGSKLGLGGRHVSYKTNYFTTQTQEQIRLQASHVFDLGTVELEPLIQGLLVSPNTATPEASVTVRKEFVPQKVEGFSRVSYSKRVPSLMDLYYKDPWFVGNSNLTAESIYTAMVGADFTQDRLKNLIQVYIQSVDNAIVTYYDSKIGSLKNSGDAWIASALHQIQIKASERVDLSHGLHWSNSYMKSTNSTYPYMPTWTSLVNLAVHTSGDEPKWTLVQTLRTSTQAATSTGQKVGGYMLWDLGGRVRIAQLRHVNSTTQSLYLTGRIENMTNRTNIELIRDYPLPGRTVIANITAEF